MADSNTIPSAALPFAIFVLIYSLINALASSLVVYMQWRHSSRLSLISLAAIIITVGIVLSMIQQVNFIITWRAIRIAAYQTAVAHSRNPSYAFVSTYNQLDTIVFLIRFYCYNAQSLLFLFWAIGLWRATWNARPDLLNLQDENIVLGAKIFALLFPILIVSTMREDFVMKHAALKLVWSNLILILSTSAGCVFLVLILYTYLHVRRKAACAKNPGPMPNLDVSFRVNRSDTDSSEMPTKPAPATSMRSLSYDRWLIVRFLICFAISNVMQVCLIIFYCFSFDRNTVILEQGGPDYSLDSTLDELGITMPGASMGLLIFVVFGTTAPFRREYKKWLQPCRRRCQGRHGPIMVVPLESVNAANNEALPGRRRSFDEERNAAVNGSSTRSSASSTWELPPMDFDEFSEQQVLPRPRSSVGM